MNASRFMRIFVSRDLWGHSRGCSHQRNAYKRAYASACPLAMRDFRYPNVISRRENVGRIIRS